MLTNAHEFLAEKLAPFSDHWSPRVIAELNDYPFNLVKVQGEFRWHQREDTEEAFIVIEGQWVIEFRDGRVEPAAGEMFVIEPKGVVNSGDAGGSLTAKMDAGV